MKLSFTKMQGCANDYIYLDFRESGVPGEHRALSQDLSRRHFSIGADGIICISRPGDGRRRRTDAHLQRRQQRGPDAATAYAAWLSGSTPTASPKRRSSWTPTAVQKTITRKGRQLWQVEMGGYSAMAAALPAVNMGEGPLVDCPLTVEDRTWRVTCISVGNPHCVTVVDDVDSLKLEDIGPAFEKHPNFPERVNTEFVQVVDSTHLKMRVWERGSGETWACGTGTCATVAALTELGVCPAGEDVHVQLRGGELIIRVLPGKKLLMTGSAVTVYEGVTEV